MNMLKKIFAGVALTAAFATAGHTAEINIGGVVFDPDYNAGGVETDFTSEFKFTQWFGTNLGTKGAVNFADATAAGTVFSAVNGTSGSTGYYLQGAGRFDRINDAANNIDAGFGGAGSFCPGCQLTFGFGGIGLNKDSTFDTANAWARIYVDNKTVFNSPVTSQTVANNALDGQVWLDLGFKNLQFEGGNVLNALVSATFDIIGGLAANNFNPKTLVYSGSSFFRPANLYSSSGNGQMDGNTVPEPGTIALLGLGLLGVALARRKALK